MNTPSKLAILADAAQYDASGASSGAPKRHSMGGKGIGSTEGSGICHSYTPDGRCISLLKILRTNFCQYDCLYCVNRVSSNVERARFTVDEVVQLTLDFYRRNGIEGLFLSSGIIQSPDYTMEQVVEVARVLREEHDFRGYIHLKTIPEASPELMARAGRYADRLSISIELPTEEGLAQLAPEKNTGPIRRSMAHMANGIADANPARLKLDMMRKEMPRRYWHNLPEAQLIGELAQTAQQRSCAMVAAEPSTPRRRIVPLVVEHAHGGGFDLDAVRTAPDLTHLYAQTHSCRACAIGAHATQAVPGEGMLNPARMLVGEQPGDNEDLQGRAFVGPAGQLLNTALQQLGWPRGDHFLTNAVKHFKYEPRGKRRIHQRPGVGEVQACSMFLDREIELVAPQTLLALGATAAHALLGHAVKVEDVRGRWQIGVHGLPVLVAWHPSALLRAPQAERATLMASWLHDLATALPEALATRPRSAAALVSPTAAN